MFSVLIIINYLCGIIPHQPILLVWHDVATEITGAAKIATVAPVSTAMQVTFS